MGMLSGLRRIGVAMMPVLLLLGLALLLAPSDTRRGQRNGAVARVMFANAPTHALANDLRRPAQPG